MKYIYLISISFFCFTNIYACDICGCGVGNNYVGLLPEFKKNIFGMRYRGTSITTHLGPNNSTTYLTTKERYHNVDIWGAFTLFKKWRVMVTIPTSQIQRENSTVNAGKTGINDIAIIGFYNVVQQQKVVNSKLVYHSLWIGTGTKLPTGNYNDAEKNSNNSNTANLFQLGSGSIDLLGALIYDVGVNNTGINVSVNYKHNTINKFNYAYGNKWTISTQAYHKFIKGKKTSIVPNIGLQVDVAQKNTDYGSKVFTTGGTITLATGGMELTHKRLAVGLNVQLPIQQFLGEGTVVAGNKYMLHFAFLF